MGWSGLGFSGCGGLGLSGVMAIGWNDILVVGFFARDMSILGGTAEHCGWGIARRSVW